MSAMHGLVDLPRNGRTIPHKAATVDEQIQSMLEMVLDSARTQSRADHGGFAPCPASSALESVAQEAP